MASEASTDYSDMMSTFQLSLNIFPGASEQAVENLSPNRVTYKPKTFMDKFRELPVEIRCMIYKILFKGATLVVDYEDLRDAAPTGRLKANSVSIDEILKMITKHKAALLIANDWCKEEAVDLLAQNTTIKLSDVEPNNDIRDDILATIDHSFLSHVTKMVIPPINFLRANRNLLPKLKEIRLFHLHIYEFDHDLFIHHLLCPGCRDPSGQWLYSACKNEVLDRDWQRKQLLHLSEQNKWAMHFVCEFFSMYEFEYSLETERLISKMFVRMADGKMEYIKLRSLDQLRILGVIEE